MLGYDSRVTSKGLVTSSMVRPLFRSIFWHGKIKNRFLWQFFLIPFCPMARPLKTVPAFYEPGALAVVPRLIAQTDILLHSHQFWRPLKGEELSVETRSGAVRTHHTSARSSARYSSQPYHTHTVAFDSVSRSPSPQTLRTPTPAPTCSTQKSAKSEKPKQQVVSNARPSHEDDVDSDAADAPDASEISSDLRPDYPADIHPITIQKPRGEVGRPGSGGYNLEDELSLHPKSFKELKVRVVPCVYDIH